MRITLTRCPNCGRRTIVTRRADRRYGRRVVRNVPVQACTHCDAVFLDLDAAGIVDRALGLRRRTRRDHAA